MAPSSSRETCPLPLALPVLAWAPCYVAHLSCPSPGCLWVPSARYAGTLLTGETDRGQGSEEEKGKGKLNPGLEPGESPSYCLNGHIR